jgi:U3 small nucleolar RNA-associated protein 12
VTLPPPLLASPGSLLLSSLISRPVSDRDGSYKVLASTSSNTLEVYRVTVPSQRASAAPNQYSLAKLSVLEMHGHRSDVRCVCVSSDGLSIATVSSEGAKIWSTKSFSCIRSCATGYGVSMTFITGNRYILIGTKEGRIQIVDSSIGELVVDQEAHEGPVWSVALQPPDGKAFMSGGADKVVKFWDFTVPPPPPACAPPRPEPVQVTNGSLGIELSRQLMMTHDIMCVGYRYPPPPSLFLLLTPHKPRQKGNC